MTNSQILKLTLRRLKFWGNIWNKTRQQLVERGCGCRADVLRWGGTHAVWAAPLPLRGFVQLRLKADQVVSSGTGVAQDDLAALLAHLAVVLMIRLVTVPLLLPQHWRARRPAQ